jgi:hypothetical protein
MWERLGNWSHGGWGQHKEITHSSTPHFTSSQPSHPQGRPLSPRLPQVHRQRVCVLLYSLGSLQDPTTGSYSPVTALLTQSFLESDWMCRGSQPHDPLAVLWLEKVNTVCNHFQVWRFIRSNSVKTKSQSLVYQPHRCVIQPQSGDWPSSIPFFHWSVYLQAFPYIVEVVQMSDTHKHTAQSESEALGDPLAACTRERYLSFHSPGWRSRIVMAFCSLTHLWSTVQLSNSLLTEWNVLLWIELQTHEGWYFNVS